MKKIKDIACKLGINDNIINYGDYRAKVDFSKVDNLKKGKLILMTATTPTPHGEGKTTMSIGLNDALNKLGYNSLLCLREPSLGPVFGFKGGAIGGGKAKVVPSDDINMHFNGDMHAITTANNLLVSAIYNHIYQGNILNVKEVCIKRVMDINDRNLRVITDKYGFDSGFDITAACEMMSIFCLATSISDLRYRLNNMIFGYDLDGNPLKVSLLGITDALIILLKDAIKPNLVQTLEGNPVLIHGGPFANVSIGCSSLISTNLALKLSDYVITEAGFGSDLGAEKFLDIVCKNDIKPSLIIIDTTIRSLKYNKTLEEGFNNLFIHYKNMRSILDNVLVCLNKFDNDSDSDIEKLKELCFNKNMDIEISEAYSKGGEGAISLAKKVVSNLDDKKINYVYNDSDSLMDKIEKVCLNIYHSNPVYSEKALEKIEILKKNKLDNLPICIAKTPYEINGSEITDLKVFNGAGFITVYMGGVLTMPGLSKEPNFLKMKIDDNENISGIS